MLWRVLQILIAVAVLFANIHWQWTDNGLIAGAWAICAAVAISWTISKVIDVKRYGWAGAMPPTHTIVYVSAVTVGVVVGIVLLGALFVYVGATFFPSSRSG